MERVKAQELVMAARVADALVYAAGIAGVIAGGLLFRDGETAFAFVAWVVTFIAGAGLRLAAWASRALAELLQRSARIEEDLARLLAQRPDAPRRAQAEEEVSDPYRRWGGWH